MTKTQKYVILNKRNEMSEKPLKEQKNFAGGIKQLKIPCEVYSRVVGYYSPVQNWNIGKQQEYKERKSFKVFERQMTSL